MAFDCGDSAITDVFPCLWFTEVIACDFDSSTITDDGESQQEVAAVVTSSVVGP